MELATLDKYTAIIKSTCFGDMDWHAFQIHEGKVEHSKDPRFAKFKDQPIEDVAKWCKEKEESFAKQFVDKYTDQEKQQLYAEYSRMRKEWMRNYYEDKELRDFENI